MANASDISATVDDTRILDEDDLDEVIGLIQDLKAHYFTLGTALKLKLNTVEDIKREKLDHRESLLKVVNEWLLKNYNCKKFGEPTWKLLVKAVASPMGGNNSALAMTIAEKYPAGQVPSNGTSAHNPTNGQTCQSPALGSSGATPQQPAGSTRTVVESQHFGNLCERLCTYAAQWEAIARSLGFKPGEINNIKMTNSNMAGGPQACLAAMLGEWINWAAGDGRGSKDRATLEALKKALYKAQCGPAAENLTLSEE